MGKKLFLLDAYALIYRAHFAFINNPRINSKGLNTSAIFGFCNSLLEVINNHQPTHLAVVFDPPGGSNRSEVFVEYKANREEMPEDIRKSIPVKTASSKKTTQVAHFEPEGEIIEGAAWTKKSGKNPKGGLNEKGRKSYERENPGSDLKAPSKKVGNKRRASFCARMKGMKKKLTSKKTANDPNSRINKSLRAWNC